MPARFDPELPIDCVDFFRFHRSFVLESTLFTVYVRSFQLNRSAVIPPKITCGHIYAYVVLHMLMKRTALFLKEQQLEKLQTLSRKTGAPIAELVRRAIDAYLLSRKNELK